MVPIPNDKKRGWTVYIDGKEVTDVQSIKIESKFGTLSYGLRPEGYDSWVFREQGGGGAVTVPYALTPDGEVLVGLLLENRSNMGPKPVWCAIGGFVDLGETHMQAQTREAHEETGLDTKKAIKLYGMPTNSNRAFFVADANNGGENSEGVHAYRLPIPFDWLEPDGDSFRFKLKNTITLPNFKKAGDLRLFHWREAINCSPDALARSAIAQLLATM